MKHTLFALLIFLSFGGNAQTGIRFEKGSLAEAQAKAAQAGKILFIDCFSYSCGPCANMEKTVFTDSVVASFFNTNFLNYKLDMLGKEGKTFGKQHEVVAWPTFIYMDEKGEVLVNESGTLKIPQFIAQGERALRREKTDAVKFAQGCRDEEVIHGHFDALLNNRLYDTFETEFNRLYSERGGKLLSDPYYWDVFMRGTADINSPAVLYFSSHTKELAERHGNNPVRWKLRQLYASFNCAYNLYEDGGADKFGMPDNKKQLLSEKRESYFRLMESRKLPGVKELQQEIDFICLMRDRRYDEAIALGEKALENSDARRLCDWAALAERGCRGNASRSKASVWAKRATELCDDQDFLQEARTVLNNLNNSENPFFGRGGMYKSLPVRKM